MKIYPLQELTPKQYRVLHYIKGCVNEYGTFPSYTDIMQNFEFSSPNSVNQNLKALEKKGYLKKKNGQFILSEDRDSQHEIPIKGHIQAGKMTEAIDADLGSLSLKWLFPKYRSLYALKISGQSMVGDALEDGDFAILADEAIRNGEIAALMVDGQTTLKHVYREGRNLRLKASNPDFEDMVLALNGDTDIRILGKMVGYANEKGIFKV